ncbi:hypothetical protein BSR29_06470 [Boudabousia liubingyangii]|uniref:Uncharacterized protein n=1 Tax=Boudabousia liubingyangii TaxID=1921764 RepID=A0A1Q5PKT9_9ACTO|nr:hypothetical protein [Boudabousia liubingyangii]OKL47259.1 hypothetical protein BSR29_06470 [Boudabousia liubingyangii]
MTTAFIPLSADPSATTHANTPEPGETPEFWPWNLTRDSDRELKLDGLSLAEIQSQFGDQTVILDEVDLISRLFVWRSALSEACWEGYGMSGATVFYDVSAGLSAELAKQIVGSGIHLRANSLQQLRELAQWGINGESILLVLSSAAESASANLLKELSDLLDSHSLLGLDLVIASENLAQELPEVLLAEPKGTFRSSINHLLIDTQQVSAKTIQSLTSHPEAQINGVATSGHESLSDLSKLPEGILRLLKGLKQVREAGATSDFVILTGYESKARLTGSDPQPLSANEISLKMAETVRIICQQLDLTIPSIYNAVSTQVLAQSTLGIAKVGNESAGVLVPARLAQKTDPAGQPYSQPAQVVGINRQTIRVHSWISGEQSQN